MEIYDNITSKTYSYVVVDNKADTPSSKQVIAEVFGYCVSYIIMGVETGDKSYRIKSRQCEM